MLSNTVDPEQTPLDVASDLGLHSFPMTLYGFQVVFPVCHSIFLFWKRRVTAALCDCKFKKTVLYGTPEGTFPFRYLSEKKLKQGN